MEKEMYQSMYETETYHWYFKSKYEIVLALLEKKGLRVGSKVSIADFGCGCGVMLQYLSRYGVPVGIDFSDDALRFCNEDFKGELIQANLEEYDSKNRYDYAVALDVIEHIQNDERALENIVNAMKPNGICIITVPAFRFLWSAHDENCMHKRRYSQKELQQKIEKSGAVIEYCSYYNFWSFPCVCLIRKVENLFHLKNRGSKLEYGFKQGKVNTILYKIFSSEKKWICKGRSFPFGVSIICVVRKKKGLAE